MAQDVYEAIGLDHIYFIPAAQSPLKENLPQVSPEDRLAMLDLALEGNPRFGRLGLELERGGLSYTVNTVQRLCQKFPSHRLFWIIGADQLVTLPHWHRIHALVKMVEFVCLPRPAHTLERPAINGLRLHTVSGHPFGVSSCEIRERFRKRLPANLFLPPKVVSYIQTKKLYQ